MAHPSEEREKSLENARATPDEGTDEAPDFWPANGKSVDQRGAPLGRAKHWRRRGRQSCHFHFSGFTLKPYSPHFLRGMVKTWPG